MPLYSLHRHLTVLVSFFVLLGLAACGGEEENGNADATADGDDAPNDMMMAQDQPEPDMTPDVEPETGPGCEYPGHDGFINIGKVMPALDWGQALRHDGSPVDISMEAFHCDKANDKYNKSCFE